MTGLAHKDDYLETPKWIINDIENDTGLKLEFDICATPENAKFNDYYTERDDALNSPWHIFNKNGSYKNIFCNPPRSKNGKFVNMGYNEWNIFNINLVMLLTWNDFGNKYGEKVIQSWKNNEVKIKNLRKVTFEKNGIITKWPSRLNYCWVWFKKRG